MTNPQTGKTTADWLAARLAGLQARDVPPSAFHAARRCLVDVLGCAAAGRAEPAVRTAQEWAGQVYASGTSAAWFAHAHFSPVAAAFVNASAASILDLDDGHRAAAGHPGAAIIPAALAVGQALGASMEDILLAIIAGYEAGVGCADLRTPAARANVATGRWSAIGVAAAVAKLNGHDVERTRHALTVAEAHAPNLLAADHSGFQGGHVKEGIPWSVVAGFGAADLAGLGFKGYDASLSNPGVYGERPAGAGSERFLIETTYFKRYACCRWTHSAVDAAVDLMQRVPADARVESVVIETFARAATLPNHAQPADVISAQFSLPFVVAAAVVHGADALLPLDPRLLRDEAVVRLARNIEVRVDPALDAMFPAKVPARVRIATSHGASEQLVVSPLGDWDHPMSDEALVAKALHLAGRGESALVPASLLRGLLTGDVAPATLFAALAAPDGRA
ncbi:MAG: 2-methylcitrate dehydratase PrpD [Ramlibacter sp.]|nr:2-methylcitrate dehydratase PrpD [Ramlibacter sp.]